MVKPVVSIRCFRCQGFGFYPRPGVMCTVCLGACCLFVPKDWKPGQPTGLGL